MSFQDHLKTCDSCRKRSAQSQKPTIRVKSASSYNKQKKLTELGAVIRGVSYPSLEPISTFKTKAKGASSSSSSFANYSKVNGPLALEKEKKFKLKELGKMIRGL